MCEKTCTGSLKGLKENISKLKKQQNPYEKKSFNGHGGCITSFNNIKEESKECDNTY